MYLLDILSTSPHYSYSKWIGATKENFDFDRRFKGLIELRNVMVSQIQGKNN